MPEITVFQNNKKIFCVPLDSSCLTIGRSSKNDLILTGDQISRHHAVIEKKNDEFWIQDISTAGTKLNNTPLTEATLLENGAKIQIADWLLVFTPDSNIQKAEQGRKQTQITKLTTKASYDATHILQFEAENITYKQIKPCLMIEDSNQGSRKHNVKKNRLVVGSAKNCDIILKDDFVSKYHAEFRLSDLGFHVIDLDSTNGTFVNKSKIKESYLKGGESIELGNSKIVPVFEETKQTELEPFNEDNFCGIYASSHSMRLLFSKIQKVATTDMTVMIQGETGSGKEMVAQAIHDLSSRRNKPYLVINCSAISANLIESELFGHEKGAFTGADQRHLGAFEQANSGTIFLDEIGELPLELQSKLLRVLEYQTLRRVGGTQDIKVNVRIVAATHRDLVNMVAKKEFREDLFYRLFVINLTLPPLRERKEDIPLLAKVFVDKCSLDKLLYIDQQAIEKLKMYSWPGNVRELKNTVLRAIAFCQNNVITENDIEFLHSKKTQEPAKTNQNSCETKPNPEQKQPSEPNHNTEKKAEKKQENNFPPIAITTPLEKRKRKKEKEKQKIELALKQANGDRNIAAKLLGIGRSTLFRKLKDLDLETPNKTNQE